VFTDPASLAAHDRPDSNWNRQALGSALPDPFCATTAWQLSFREAFDPQRRIVIRESSDGLVQFAVHRLGEQAMLGPIERMWAFGCNVLGPAGLELLDELARDPAMETSALGYCVVVSGLDPSGPLPGAIKARFGSPREPERLSSGIQCAASLEGGLDGFLSRRSANHRKKLRKGARRASEAGIRFERHAPASAEAAHAVFARMLAVERVSWKGIDECGMDDPETSRFYNAMLRRLSASCDGRVIFATHEQRDVGYIFGGMAGAVYRGQQFSFDADFSGMSIGNLMQYEQVAWLCEEGAQRYDMGPLLGRGMEYKRHWTELHFPIEAWRIDFARKPRGTARVRALAPRTGRLNDDRPVT